MGAQTLVFLLYPFLASPGPKETFITGENRGWEVRIKETGPYLGRGGTRCLLPRRPLCPTRCDHPHPAVFTHLHVHPSTHSHSRRPAPSQGHHKAGSARPRAHRAQEGEGHGFRWDKARVEGDQAGQGRGRRRCWTRPHPGGGLISDTNGQASRRKLLMSEACLAFI